MHNAIAPRRTPIALEPPAHASQALGFISGLVAGTQPVTWVFAGDSITHGALYTEGWRSFPEHFAERIRWELRRSQDVVINTGVFGEKSAGLLANLEARALRFLPDTDSILRARSRSRVAMQTWLHPVRPAEASTGCTRSHCARASDCRPE